jgi:predicted protein tyrosine phosphatase
VSSLIKDLKLLNKKIAWITIADNQKLGLVRGGNKYVLPLYFEDVEKKAFKESFTKNQARKVKNFIINHHLNNKIELILFINCAAGVSRSTAIGKYAELKFNISTRYTELESKRMISPNHLVLERLGMIQYVRNDSLTEYHPEFGFED